MKIGLPNAILAVVKLDSQCREPAVIQGHRIQKFSIVDLRITILLRHNVCSIRCDLVDDEPVNLLDRLLLVELNTLVRDLGTKSSSHYLFSNDKMRNYDSH